MKNFKLFAFLMFVLSADTALAVGGHEIGNGGEPNCSQYYSYFSKITLAIQEMGQARVDQTNKKISVKDIWELRRQVRCIPAGDLDRGARSNSTTKVTSLDFKKWNNDTIDQKIRLVTHEICVLLKLDGEGEYYNSEDLYQIVLFSPKINEIRAIEKDFSTRASGSIRKAIPKGPESLDQISIDIMLQEEIYQQLASLTEGLNNAVNDLGKTADFKTEVVQSSDPAVVTGVASVSARISSVTLSVEGLATNESWVGAFTGVNNAVTTQRGTLTLKLRGRERAIMVVAGTTLVSLAAQINSENMGVSASVYNTGDGSANAARIDITDLLPGKANRDPTPGANFNLSITSSLTLLPTEAFGSMPVTEGLNAKIKVGGLAEDIYRESNEVADVVPGVTLNLISAQPGVKKTLTITENTSNAVIKIKKFIEKYNQLITALRKAIISGPTTGDLSLLYMFSKLTTTVTDAVPKLPENLSIHSLVDLGIETVYSSYSDQDNDTQILSNESRLMDELVNYFEDLTTFFAGKNEVNGFSSYFAGVLSTMIDPSTGILPKGLANLQRDSLQIMDQYQKQFEENQKLNHNGEKK
ncbi:MAG: flagellar hook-associated protein FliD [Bacteriovoracaceae bacterium]|nr:flagellar hook-associated protein FliD [Bacteriovoracaceae bacterium]